MRSTKAHVGGHAERTREDMGRYKIQKGQTRNHVGGTDYGPEEKLST